MIQTLIPQKRVINNIICSLNYYTPRVSIKLLLFYALIK